MRFGRLALVAVTGLLAAFAGTVLTVAANAATGGSVSWFPLIERDPLWWMAGSTIGVTVAGLLVWSAQRRYDAGRRQTAPPVQRPEPWMVPRPTEVTTIVNALRDGGTVGVTAAIHGAGGFGKTTVAKMVRSDPRVLSRFGGRVYWVTIGRDADRRSLTGLVNDLIIRLEPDRPVTFTDSHEAAEHLAAVLARGPRRLLVLDDVWSRAQLDAFPVAGRCARLVTTRNAALVAGIGFPVLVDKMTEHQAYAVLSAGLPDLQPAVAAQLSAEAGCWPLLLRLVNKILIERARLQPDVTVAAGELLALLRQGKALRLDRLSATTVNEVDVGESDQRATSVHATIEASVGMLDPGQRARFAELAVFAEDESIPASLAAALWEATGGLDKHEAFALLARAADLALLTLARSPDGGTVELHDVIRDFLSQELGEPRLRRLHRALLRCAATGLPAASPGSGEVTVTAWWELPERPRYLRDHLIEHLIAGHDTQRAELAATDLRWIAARLQQSGPAAPYGDLSLIGSARTQRLQRLLSQSAHLLAATDPAYSQTDILYSRVSHDPDWGAQGRSLQIASIHPALVSELPLPDLPDPDLRRTLTGHNSRVNAMAAAPDGTWLATGSDDRTVRIWDTATGRLCATLAGHRARVTGMAVAPDGTWLASAGGDEDWPGAPDRAVLIWDTATWTRTVTLTGHGEKVTAVAVAPDGAWLASADGGGTVLIWDAVTWTQTAKLAVADTPVNAVAVAPDGTWLTLGMFDGSVRIWDARTSTQIATLAGHVSKVTSVAIAPDGTWLASAGDDGTVRIWDAATWAQTDTLTGHIGAVTAVAVAPDGTWLASAGDEGAVLIWDAAPSASTAKVTRHSRSVSAVAVAPDSTWLATTSAYNGIVQIWDAASGQERTTLTGFGRWSSAVAIAPDGTWLAIGIFDGTIEIRSTTTWTQTAKLAGHNLKVTTVAIAPDGTWLAAVSGDGGTLRIWDTRTWTLTASIRGDDWWVAAAAIAPDGTWLASVGGDGIRSVSYGMIRIWDTATWTQTAALTGLSHPVKTVAVAPDGTWLATVGGDGAPDGIVRIWDTVTWSQSVTLTGHAGKVTAIAVAPDGAWLATVGDDATLRVWDRATGTSCAIMRVDGPLTDCKWSPTGMSIAAAGAGGWYYFTFRP